MRKKIYFFKEAKAPNSSRHLHKPPCRRDLEPDNKQHVKDLYPPIHPSAKQIWGSLTRTLLLKLPFKCLSWPSPEHAQAVANPGCPANWQEHAVVCPKYRASGFEASQKWQAWLYRGCSLHPVAGDLKPPLKLDPSQYCSVWRTLWRKTTEHWKWDWGLGDMPQRMPKDNRKGSLRVPTTSLLL